MKKGLQWWKVFYKKEREDLTQHILIQATQHRSHNNARVNCLADILTHGGALSFPHTFLRDNLTTYLDICSALYKSHRTELVLIGVLHSSNPKDIKKEFSLDNFEYVLRLYAEANALRKIPVHKRYFPCPAPKDIEGHEWKNYLAYLRATKEEVLGNIKKTTAILTTGDLCHYGHGYAGYHRENTMVHNNPEIILAEKIKTLMETLFIKGNRVIFVQQSRVLLNDQISAAILIKELFGEHTAFKLFEIKFSDYSQVFSSKIPTIVASVFYGVRPK